MKLLTFPSYIATSRALIFRIVELMNEYPEKEFNIAVSGGATPAILFELWANEYQEITSWDRIRIFFVDERCVPSYHAESNYALVNSLLLSKVPIPKSNIFCIDGENDPYEESLRYSKCVVREVPLFNNLPQFDIILLGIGSDGHISSIFPNQKELLTSREIYAVANNPMNGQMRIALTGPTILNCKHLLFFVMGKNKAEIMHSIITKNSEVPASYIIRNRDDVEMFLDDTAASLIH